MKNLKKLLQISTAKQIDWSEIDICDGIATLNELDMVCTLPTEIQHLSHKKTLSLKATLKAGLPIESAEEYEERLPIPQQSYEESWNVQVSLLADTLNAVKGAQSKDPTRYVLNGILFESDHDGLRLVATDGRRLYVEPLLNGTFPDAEMIFPSGYVESLLRWLKALPKGAKVEIENSERWMRFRVAGSPHLFAVQKVCGNYPNYSTVIPSDEEHRPLSCILSDLQTEVARCKAMNRNVLLELSDKSVTVKACGKNGKKEPIGEEGMTVATMQTFSAQPEASIGFDSSFLSDLLTNADLAMVREQNVLKAYTERGIRLLMPMRTK